MAVLISGRRGSCVRCGKRGPLTDNGRPLPHGKWIRRGDQVLVLPGLCPGVLQEAEWQTLFGKPLEDFPELSEEPEQPESAGPPQLHIGGSLGALLVRISTVSVYLDREGKAWQTGQRGPQLASQKGVRTVLAHGWAVLGDDGFLHLTEAGVGAKEAYRARLRAEYADYQARRKRVKA